MDNPPEMISLSSALDIYCRHLGLNAENAAAIKSLVAPNQEGLIWLLDEPLMVHKLGSDFAVDRSELTKILDNLFLGKLADLRWEIPCNLVESLLMSNGFVTTRFS